MNDLFPGLFVVLFFGLLALGAIYSIDEITKGRW